MSTSLRTLPVLLVALALPLTAQEVMRLRILPPSRVVAVGDSLRLVVEALDAGGRVVAGVPVRFAVQGGRMQGSVDSTGLVRAGSPGVIPLSIAALPRGGRPVVEKIEVRLVPGPTRKVDVAPVVTKMLVGQRIRLDATPITATGDAREDVVSWASSNPRVASVTDGLLAAVGPGTATLTVRAGTAETNRTVQVLPSTGVTATLAPTTVRARQGDVVRFALTVKDARGQAITGLTPAWSFSPGQGAIDQDGAFVGNVPGRYSITASLGAREAVSTVTLTTRDVRRQAKVVGHLNRAAFPTSEVWVHPDGKHAYLGTTLGGDRIYAINIADPSKLTITDSIVANSRSMNDMMTTEDGKWLVFTREGATDRRNGIVIASVADPAHPKPVAEFTDGVTAGVHSAFVYTQAKHGTHVYLTNSGTGALNIIDINDPTKPRRVGEWISRDTRAGRSLHDIDVKDGIAYVSYWSDGLVILDVGNGLKGGSPSNPVMISNYRYNSEALYPGAASDWGPGFISGTHTAWRHGRYVFIADEVFPPYAPTGTWDVATIRAYGRLQVIDVSNIEQPKSVAWYEPEYGGAHNIWAAGDTLYLGAYNGGFQVFDVSGELRGDLKAQGRTIAEFMPASSTGHTPNKTMTWGVVVKNGHAFVNDMLSGLWVVKLEPKPVVP
ncbi:MAG: Ig-like domain-containing protein [Gemmatimonadetes bacterium]|nr:Ig-like domain-containing protein [Gemmatimonadota bacterium]